MTEFSTPVAVETKTKTGLCTGTTVMTMAGEVPIEHLQPGDRIITRDSGVTTVQAVKTSTQKMPVIRIKAGSLGHPRPDRDMIVTPGTRLHIRDWRAEALFGKASASVPAERLVDGEFLSEQPAREITTYEIDLDREHIIYADGIELIAG